MVAVNAAAQQRIFTNRMSQPPCLFLSSCMLCTDRAEALFRRRVCRDLPGWQPKWKAEGGSTEEVAIRLSGKRNRSHIRANVRIDAEDWHAYPQETARQPRCGPAPCQRRRRTRNEDATTFRASARS